MTKKDDKKTVVVMGQRRSGTSMLAGVLYNLGVYMGENPERSSEKNESGFYEDQEIVEISRKIISFVMEGGTKAGVEKEFGPEITKLFRKRDKEHGTWGFKDVNQVQTHFLFRKKIKNPKYFVVFRNPLDTALSVSSWHGVNLLESLGSVNDNNSMIQQYMLTTLAGDPVVAVSYEKMLTEPEATVDTIIEFLEIEPTKEQKKNAVKHIKPELNHYGRE